MPVSAISMINSWSVNKEGIFDTWLRQKRPACLSWEDVISIYIKSRQLKILQNKPSLILGNRKPASDSVHEGKYRSYRGTFDQVVSFIKDFNLKVEGKDDSVNLHMINLTKIIRVLENETGERL